VQWGDDMNVDAPHVSRERHALGYIGAVLLLLIIPVKLLRLSSAAGSVAVGVAPSLLGPSGLLFLLLSSPGRLSRLTIAQTAILAGVISVGLELAQLLPRPGILHRVRYTFDTLDLLATLAAVAVSSVIAKVVLGGRRHEEAGPHVRRQSIQEDTRKSLDDALERSRSTVDRLAGGRAASGKTRNGS
jgi:hypothetical protein